MDQIGEFYTWLKIIGFILVGLGIGFLSWHPSQNDYVSEINYDILDQKYQRCEQEKQEIKEDVGKLLIEYYGKSLVWDILGVTKHQKLLCALRIVLKNEIPLIDKLPC